MQTARLELEETNRVELRPTVAGLLVKRDDKGIHIGMHQSVRAMSKGYVRYTTVGGGIIPLEDPSVAMARELGEEYGENFARECTIETLLASPIDGAGWSGTKKSYWWFLLIQRGDTIPSVQHTECADFRWCSLRTIQDGRALQHFSPNKKLMLWHALERATQAKPDLFK
jgi:8-oxo-dGTP pyrophosphatase MutT (NUDIX family)